MCSLPGSAHAFVGLGANMPAGSASPRATLEQALRALQQLSAAPLLQSSFYQSDPKDCPPGSPVYINAVAALLPQAGETALSLLHKLQHIEAELGRVRSGLRNEPRALDLDLLSFGSSGWATQELQVPHPRAHERRFVLEPWVEVAGPEWLLAGQTLGYWLQVCQDPALQKLP